MNNQELTVKQKHVIHTRTWNEKNPEYFKPMNKLRAEKYYKTNAIPKLRAIIKQYEKRLQQINKEIQEKTELRILTKQQLTKSIPIQRKLEVKTKPTDSTICHICNIPYSTKEQLLRHNARRHTTNSLEEK